MFPQLEVLDGVDKEGAEVLSEEEDEYDEEEEYGEEFDGEEEELEDEGKHIYLKITGSLDPEL